MAYINVPKDIVKIEEKWFFNLTKRQLISLSLSIFIVSSIFTTLKSTFGVEATMFISFIIISPIFLWGWYRDENVYLEDKIKNIIYFYKNKKPKVYKSENFYNKILLDSKIEKIIKR